MKSCAPASSAAAMTRSIGIAGIGERDVVADGAVEQHVLLQHDADLAPQPGDVDHGEIDAVDQHAPALGHVEPLDQLGERALARARGADDADAPALPAR